VRQELSREPIDSSVIASMGYAPAQHILEIEFQNGEIYDYFDVPEEDYAAFAAPSPKAPT